PIDLVTEWRRCGIISDFAAAYLEWAFARRSTARSVVSTVVNELVENAAKFSVDNRVHTDVTIRHYGEILHAEVRNEAAEGHVARLTEVLEDLARDGAEAVFRRRIEGRSGLGLALIARDYNATVGARVTPGCTPGGKTVCLRVALSVQEVEQR
ncbi:MAG TPA: ATP-binding protein, partial [Anaeromyxobacter sp.]